MDLLLGLFFGCGVFAGVIAYLLARRDLSPKWAALTAVGCGVVVGATSLFVIYLAPLSFIAAAAAYLVLRRRLSVKHALVASATTFAGLLAASVLAFWLTLTYSM